MLVLTRKLLQKVEITHNGEVLTLYVLGTNSSGNIRLGFEAPKSFSILREEAHAKN